MSSLRTYSHFESKNKIPSDYEIGSTDLHYYIRRGIEVQTPINEWYKTYQAGARLKCSNWDSFSDPRSTTYSSYTTRQSKKEIFTVTLFESIGVEPLAPDWQAQVTRALGAMRFLFHGLQMVAAYVGHMAPSSKLTIIYAFQAADEMRRVHNLSYRLAMLTGPEAQNAAHDVWTKDPVWQPMRKMVEELLIIYDWSEAFAVLNLAVKPSIDGLLEAFIGAIRRHGNHKFGEILGSLLEDSTWHRQWSSAFRTFLITENPENENLINESIEKWEPLAKGAVQSVVREWEVSTRG